MQSILMNTNLKLHTHTHTYIQQHRDCSSGQFNRSGWMVHTYAERVETTIGKHRTDKYTHKTAQISI